MAHGTLAAAVAALSIAAVASATSLDINGGTSWGGWNSAGNALTDGIWARGGTAAIGDYEIYTTSFYYDSSVHNVTGSPVGNSSFAGTGFQNGSVVVGVGIRMVNPGTYNFLSNTGVPTLKFDPNNNSYQAATSVGALDGQSSFSGFADAGDFNFQANGIQGQGVDYTPSVFVRSEGAGVPFFQQVLGGTSGPARSFYAMDGTAFQMFFDLTELQASPWDIDPVTGQLGVVIATPFSGLSESFVTISVVPVPPAVAMGALGLLAVAARRRFSRR